MTDERNATNRLLEWLKGLGWPESCLDVTAPSPGGLQPHQVEATLRIPDLDLDLVGRGQAARVKDAKKAACADLLAQLDRLHPDLFFDQDSLAAEAQAGDALLKLSVFAWDSPLTAADRSLLLQEHETNEALARRFDELRAADPWAARLGPGVGVKARATVFEAAVWRRHKDSLGTSDLAAVFADVRAAFLPVEALAAAPSSRDQSEQ